MTTPRIESIGDSILLVPVGLTKSVKESLTMLCAQGLQSELLRQERREVSLPIVEVLEEAQAAGWRRAA